MISTMAIKHRSLKVRSSYIDLVSAVMLSGIVPTPADLARIEAVDRPPVSDGVRRYVRPCTESYVLEDGSIWYVTEGEIMTLHRFTPGEPNPEPEVYGIAYCSDSDISFFDRAFPAEGAGRDAILRIQRGLARPLAYYQPAF